ncbi:hypothetical protein AAC387_Pa08g0443 [Persea americana]
MGIQGRNRGKVHEKIITNRDLRIYGLIRTGVETKRGKIGEKRNLERGWDSAVWKLSLLFFVFSGFKGLLVSFDNTVPIILWRWCSGNEAGRVLRWDHVRLAKRATDVTRGRGDRQLSKGEWVLDGLRWSICGGLRAVTSW